MSMARKKQDAKPLALISEHPELDAWFESMGWSPFEFQREVWRAMEGGQSGLLHATTGSGKTYAVWMGALLHSQRQGVANAGQFVPPLSVLWITPMRALAGDTMRAISLPLIELRAYRPCESVCLAIGAQCAQYLQSVDQRLRAGNAECQSGRPAAAARQKPL